jgi:hypothetical protein
MADERGFDSHEDARRRLASLSHFLIVQPHPNVLIDEAREYCKAQMPHSSVHGCDIAGIPAVLEAVPKDADLYVYLDGGLHAYAQFTPDHPLDLMPRARCHAYGISVPVVDIQNFLRIAGNSSKKIIGRCREANLSLPLSRDELYDVSVVGCPAVIPSRKEDVYEDLQQLVVQSFIQKINLAQARFDSGPRRSGTPLLNDILYVTSRYALVLDDLYRRNLDEYFEDEWILPWKGYFE